MPDVSVTTSALATATLAIAAIVDTAERPALELAAARLAACLQTATDSAWRVEIVFGDNLDAVPVAPHAAVISMLREVSGRDVPARDLLASATDPASVFLCTVFRHVASVADRWQGDTAPVSIERIRRLNLLAAELSQATGANVIDIDRVFAHVGARALQTDYRLGGARATSLAADTIVAAWLTAGLGDVIAPDTQDRALEIHKARSATSLGHALSVSATSLRFTTTRHDGARQTFGAIGPVLTPATTRELLRDVRAGRARLLAVAPVILGKILRRLKRSAK